MIITNEYILIWVVATGQIVMDYTQSLKGLNVEMGNMYKSYCAETLEEIDAKVIELGLLDPDGIVTPH